MSQSTHTYGPTCHLGRSVTFTGSKDENEIPHLKAHFFYSSPLPIDDPLSAVPAPGGSESTVKHAYRPFSSQDNDELEEAWQSLATRKDKKNHMKVMSSLRLRAASKPIILHPAEQSSSARNKGTRSKGPVTLESSAALQSSFAEHNGDSCSEQYGDEDETENGTADPCESGLSDTNNRSTHAIFQEPAQSGASWSGNTKTSSKESGRRKKDKSKDIKDRNSANPIAVVMAKEPSETAAQVQVAREEGAKESVKETRHGRKSERINMGGGASEDVLLPDSVSSAKFGSPEKLDPFVDLASKSRKDTKRLSDAIKGAANAGVAKAANGAKKAKDSRQSKKNKSGYAGENTAVESEVSAKDKSNAADKQKSTDHSVDECEGDGVETQEEANAADHAFDECEGDGADAPEEAEATDHRFSTCEEDGGDAAGYTKETSNPEGQGSSTRRRSSLQADDRRTSGNKGKLSNWNLLKRAKSSDNAGPSSQGEGSHLAEYNSESVKARKHERLSGHRFSECQGDAADDNYHTPKESSKYPSVGLDGFFGTASPSNEMAKDAASDAASKTTDGAAAPMAQSGDIGTTGFPFLRVTPRSENPAPEEKKGELESRDDHHDTHAFDAPRRSLERDSTETEVVDIPGCKARKNVKLVEVPVGASRLHSVQVPSLLMKPIYWSPVHDCAVVTRATWFYKDTMLPIEPAVANRLELGYKELRPWSQTWSDELNSAIEVGAAAEEKIAHRLWAFEETAKSIAKAATAKKGYRVEHTMSVDPYCAAKCFDGQAAAEGVLDIDSSAAKPADLKTLEKKYPNSQVIYKDAQNAFILKPTLQPSAYYGRKPLQKIKKGTTIGIHCVRGFDWKAWDKLHPSKKPISNAKEIAPVSGDANSKDRPTCAACKAKQTRQAVTDLVLVVHGIGQKLSERVESFHFTHAMNSFRRSMNVELNNSAIQQVLHKELGSVMVLPINWRSSLSFEEGGPMKGGDKEQQTPDFSLQDITPTTLPAVRNMISDVMLDIPFYMSHHKPKMIAALIAEANRVYRLWCKNNPDFHDEGRVHIIAHSLGSVMALEILSKQPTLAPRLNLTSRKLNSKSFDFNTANLFLAGSPCGFFLLLEKGKLIPRRGQSKPGAETADGKDPAITGEAGTFGCLAVDNIYNIVHDNDPVAYKLNATVDPQYAASLKNARVPSATTGFFESIGNAVRSVTPGVKAPSDLQIGQVAKPAIPRLPSQLEMDVHDFSREELAERKFYLLNDNGQIDYFLSSGGGPLEIQYLNMLGAHSSYWTSPDFIRMICTEVGRRPGRLHTLPNMRAIKAARKEKRGSMA